MAAAVQTAIYELGYSTGNSKQNLDQTREAAEKLVTTTEKVAVTEEKVTKATRSTTDAMERLLARLDPRIRAEQNLQRVREQVNRAQQEGIGTTNQHARAVELAQQKVDKFSVANDNAKNALGQFQQGLGLVNRLLGAFGIAISAAAAINFARTAFENASSLDEQAQQIGVNVEALQAYRAAMLASGLSNSEADRIMQRLTRTIGEATAASGSQRDAFLELGLSADDLAGGTESALPKIAKALLAIEDPSRRARIETDLFGKAGQKLESALVALVDPTTTLIEKQRALGQIMGTEVTKAADEAADRLTSAWNRAKVAVGTAVTGILAGMFDIIDAQKKLQDQEIDPEVAFITGQQKTNAQWAAEREKREAAQREAERLRNGIPALERLGDTSNLLVNGKPRTSTPFSTQGYDTVLKDLREEAALTGKTAVERAKIVALRTAEAAKIKDGNGPLTEAERLEISRLAVVKDTHEAQQKAAKDREAANKKEQEDLEKFDGWVNKLAEDQDRLAEKERDRIARVKQNQDDYIQDLRDEVQLAGMSREEAERKSIVLRGIRDLHIEAGSAQANEIESLVRARQETERWRDVVDDIASGFQNFFQDVLENGKMSFSNLWDSIKSTFARMLAQMAAQALVAPIIIPMVTEIFGGLGGLGGLGAALGMGGGAAGVAGGGGGGLGALGMLSNASSLTGLFGGNSSGLLGGLGGIGSQGFGGLFDFTAVDALGYNFTMPGSLGMGSLGGLLGGAGLGAMAGSMLFKGGDSGMGSMGGALAGAAIGSIIPGVGTIIGGLLGGLAGGGLGSLTGSSNQGAISNFTNGGLGNTLFKQGGGNNGQMATQASASINEIIKQLQDAGVSVSLGNISGLSIGSDKSYVYDFDGGKQKLAGGQAGIEATVNAILDRILPSAAGTDDITSSIVDKYRSMGGINAGNITDLANEVQAAREQKEETDQAAQELKEQIDAFGPAVDAALKAITDPVGAQFDALIAAQKVRKDEATRLGYDVAQLSALNEAEMNRFLTGLSYDQLKALSASQDILGTAAYAQAKAAQDAVDAAQAAANAAAQLATEFETLGGTIADMVNQARDAAQVARSTASAWGGAHGALSKASVALMISSPGLSPADQYNNSRSEFDRLLNAARGGNASAAGDIASFAGQFLQSSFQFNGSTTAYGSDFSYVRDTLGGLTDFSQAQQDYAQRQADSLDAAVLHLKSINASIRSGDADTNEELTAMREELAEVKGQLARLGDAVAVATK